MPDALEVALRIVIGLAAFTTLPLLVGQLEHKVMAHMQGRLGPMEAGTFHGWAQLIADGVKFAQKAAITPAAARPWPFRIAPLLALLPYMAIIAVLPIAPNLAVQTLDISLVLVLAVLGVGVLGVLVAGWSSGNKYSLLGAVRAAAQLLGYEVPLVLAAASVAVAAGTVSLTGIVEEWRPWWLLWQLPALVVFFIAALAEIRRPPFDAAIADAELVFGYLTEYTGLRFAFFLLAEYVGIVVISALTTILFLGGWRGPWLGDEWAWIWTLLKVFWVAFVVIWVRVAWPRLRIDQTQRLCWSVLVPIALAQLVLTAVVVVVRVS